jgi:hypothetical protein
MTRNRFDSIGISMAITVIVVIMLLAWIVW